MDLSVSKSSCKREIQQLFSLPQKAYDVTIVKPPSFIQSTRGNEKVQVLYIISYMYMHFLPFFPNSIIASSSFYHPGSQDSRHQRDIAMGNPRGDSQHWPTPIIVVWSCSNEEKAS